MNRQIGTGTGTIQMAAEFPNQDATLRPGGFGRIRIKTGDNQNALLVPQPAVIEVQSQYMVIVVTPENKAMYSARQGGRPGRPELDRHRGTEARREGRGRRNQSVQMFAAARCRNWQRKAFRLLLSLTCQPLRRLGGN